MHERMATVMESAIEEHPADAGECTHKQNILSRPRWPMIVLRSPKGWTGPKVVDGLQIEGTFRAHQVPMLVDPEHPEHVPLLEKLDEELQAGGIVRPDWSLDPGAGRASPEGRPADGR
jgi:xylulose-5-phosphate/fructose-6-phosphate phosphoketolase